MAAVDYPMLVVTDARRDRRPGRLPGRVRHAVQHRPRALPGAASRRRTTPTRSRSASDLLVVHVLRDDDKRAGAPLRRGDRRRRPTSSADVDWSPGPGRVPVLAGVDWFAGRIQQRFDCGDHVAHLLAVLPEGRAAATETAAARLPGRAGPRRGARRLTREPVPSAAMPSGPDPAAASKPARCSRRRRRRTPRARAGPGSSSGTASARSALVQDGGAAALDPQRQRDHGRVPRARPAAAARSTATTPCSTARSSRSTTAAGRASSACSAGCTCTSSHARSRGSRSRCRSSTSSSTCSGSTAT